MSIVVSEASTDVSRSVDVDDAGSGPERPKDRKAVSVVRHDLDVNPRSAGTQRADEFADDTLTFEATHAADHGEPGMEVQGERVFVGLDDQTLKSHEENVGVSSTELELNDPSCRGLRPGAAQRVRPG